MSGTDYWKPLADSLGIPTYESGEPITDYTDTVVTDEMVYAFLWRAGEPVTYNSESWRATRECLWYAMNNMKEQK